MKNLWEEHAGKLLLVAFVLVVSLIFWYAAKADREQEASLITADSPRFIVVSRDAMDGQLEHLTVLRDTVTDKCHAIATGFSKVSPAVASLGEVACQ